MWNSREDATLKKATNTTEYNTSKKIPSVWNKKVISMRTIRHNHAQSLVWEWNNREITNVRKMNHKTYGGNWLAWERKVLAWASLIYIISRAMQLWEIILWTIGGHKEDFNHRIRKWSDHREGRHRNIGCENLLMVRKWSGKAFPWEARNVNKRGGVLGIWTSQQIIIYHSLDVS